MTDIITNPNTSWNEVGQCASNDIDSMQDEAGIILQDEVGEDLFLHSGTFSCKDSEWNNIL